MCGTTYHPPGNLIFLGRLSVCLGVHPLSPPYQVMVGGFGGMVGGQGPGLGLVLLLGLSEIAPPGRVASLKTELLPL